MFSEKRLVVSMIMIVDSVKKLKKMMGMKVKKRQPV